jgi:hypothetical protein
VRQNISINNCDEFFRIKGGLSIGEIQCSDFMRLRFKLTIMGVLILIGFVVIGCGITTEKVLVLQDVKRGLEHRIAAPESVFTLGFIHSVHHTPVYEVIHILKDNTLMLEEVRYSSLGVGMPFDHEGGTFENTDGKFVLRFQRKFNSINISVSPIPEHTITVGGKTYPLLDFTTSDGGLLNISAVDQWLLKWKSR